MKVIRHILTTALLAGLISTSAYAAKNYYKWVDAEGVTHYSARKPLDVDSQIISVSTGLPRDDNGQPVQIDDEPNAGNPQAQATAAVEEDLKDPERCEAAQSNLKIINENARIRERLEDGTLRYLSQEEINDRKARAQKAIDESC